MAPLTVSAQAFAAPEGCDVPLGTHGDVDGAAVLLRDGSASSAGEEATAVGDFHQVLDTITADSNLVVSLGSFGGSDAEVRYSPCFNGVLFVPRGNNERTRTRNRPELLAAADAAVSGLPGGYASSDPTSAIRAGLTRLEGMEGRRLLVIETDGIPTAGCAALPSEVNVSDPTLIGSITATCTDAGLLPTVDGVDIVIVGIGRSNSAPSADGVTFLLGLNGSLCDATGAACHVDANLPTFNLTND